MTDQRETHAATRRGGKGKARNAKRAAPAPAQAAGEAAPCHEAHPAAVATKLGAGLSPGKPAGSPDPYIAYLDRFFRAWLPVYDLFGATIFPVYRAAVKAVGPKPGLTVLDACTGTGEMAIRLARRGATVTGVDVTEPMLDKARKKAADLPITFVAGDARALPFPDGSFDAGCMSLALHDMPRKVRVEVLREVARCVRGRLVIVDYHFPRWPPLRRAAVWAVQLFETAYLTRYADEEVAPLLAEAGLPEATVRTFPLLPFAIHVVALS